LASGFEVGPDPVCLLSVEAAGVDVENPSSLRMDEVVSSRTGGGKS
jgi:hypothetical protein